MARTGMGALAVGLRGGSQRGWGLPLKTEVWQRREGSRGRGSSAPRCAAGDGLQGAPNLLSPLTHWVLGVARALLGVWGSLPAPRPLCSWCSAPSQGRGSVLTPPGAARPLPALQQR